MKTEIIDSELITKEMAIRELSGCLCELSREEVDEYLDILCAINNGLLVYNLTTNKGEYLLFIKGNSIKDTKTKCKRKN